MNRWKELFDNHAIHETFKWLRDSVSTEFDDIDNNEVIEKRRFLKLLSKYEEILQNIDPELIPFNQLDSLNNVLRSQFVTHIDTYKNNGNIANLVAANDLFTNQLTPLSLFLGIGSSEPSSLVFKELEDLIDSTSQTLVTKKDSLIEEIEELSSKLEEKEQRLVELSQYIEQKKTEVDTHITEWQSQFSTAQDLRSQDFNQWRDVFYSDKNEEVGSEIESYKEKLETNFLFYKKKLDDILNDGNTKHNKILELYQITADDSVGASFLKNAKDEKKQANTWRKISISFIIVTVFWMLFTYSMSLDSGSTKAKINFINTTTNTEVEIDKTKVAVEKKPSQELNSNIVKAIEDVPWYKLFITFSLSGVLLWGSAYAAQQSTKHRKNEKQAMWFALEVRAIDPFISTLEPADRNELKKQFSQKLFGQFSDKEDDSKVIDEHVFKMITDTIGNIISKVSK